MLLSELLPKLNPKPDMVMSGVTDDSRKVQPGNLFLSIASHSDDGRSTCNFVREAINKGAVGIIYESKSSGIETTLPVFELADLAMERGNIASRYFGEPSKKMTIVAVTGTNGKTSCCHYIATALGRLGRPCGYMGTLGYGYPDNIINPGLTTPDAFTLQQILADFHQNQTSAVSLEASSHGLAQGRLTGVNIDIAVFTNMTRDHLDYHPSFRAYQAAKATLFQQPGLGTAVINIDDKYGVELLSQCQSHVITYGLDDKAQVSAKHIQYCADGLVFDAQTPWGETAIKCPLLGEFNISNVLAIISVLGSLGIALPAIAAAMNAVNNAKGRMDLITHSRGPHIIIDYAHTPDALEKVLKASRLHCESELWCVIGCGGDRDKGKRPMMGRLCSMLTEHTVLTDDNPRTEPSLSIIEDIMQGVISDVDVIVEPNRSSAIAYALGSAKGSDIVLILGKGHETYQEVEGVRIPFNDYAEVDKWLSGQNVSC